MATYLMFGKYSAQAVKGISAARTKKCADVIKKSKGKMTAMYALLGEYDLLFIADFPGTKEVIKASIGLNKLTGISFCSEPAITVAEFDKLIG